MTDEIDNGRFDNETIVINNDDDGANTKRISVRDWGNTLQLEMMICTVSDHTDKHGVVHPAVHESTTVLDLEFPEVALLHKHLQQWMINFIENDKQPQQKPDIQPKQISRIIDIDNDTLNKVLKDLHRK